MLQEVRGGIFLLWHPVSTLENRALWISGFQIREVQPINMVPPDNSICVTTLEEAGSSNSLPWQGRLPLVGQGDSLLALANLWWWWWHALARDHGLASCSIL